MPWPPWQRAPTAVAATDPPETPTEVAAGTSVDLDHLGTNIARQFHRSIYLWRAVDLLASTSASVPLVVVKENDETQLTPKEEAISRLLLYPNPQWSGAALQYFVTASIAVTNKAFLLRSRGVGDVPLELWPLQPDQVTINYRSNQRMIESFTVQNERYPVDEHTGDSDIIYIRRPALNDGTDRSPAAIAAAPAEVFTRILQRAADILANSSNITGLLSTDSELGRTAIQEIKARIDQFRTGRSASGSTLVTANAKWALTKLTDDPASALSVEMKDAIARDVVMTFGVPTQLVGIPGSDTYANLEHARVGLAQTTIQSYIALYTAALNQAFMRHGTATIVVDLEHVPAMAAARGALADQVARSDWMSVNEQRRLMGLPAFDHQRADVPIRLMEMELKLLAIEAQGGDSMLAGGVGRLLAGEPT